MRGGTYLGSVFVRRSGRLVELDARPSHAITLALGNRAPILVACRVIARAAVPRASLLETPEGPDSDIQVEGCPTKMNPSQPGNTTGPGI